MSAKLEKGGGTFAGIKLLLCENPLPPLDEAIEAARVELSRSNYYTEPHSEPLRRMLAERLGVPEGLIHVNAGSERRGSRGRSGEHATWILLVGLAIIVSGLLKSAMSALGLPAMAGYLLLGFMLSLVDAKTGVLTPPVRDAFGLLAALGVIALLFRMGLDSHPKALARKLPQAASVWIGNVVCAAALGFEVAYYVLHLPLPTALIVATALSATSVGVAVAPWEEANALGSDNGALLIDVAELDDVSAIVLMTLVLALIPALGVQEGVAQALTSAAARSVLGLVLLVGFCYLFSRFLEARVTRLAARLEPAPERMLTVAGCLGIPAPALQRAAGTRSSKPSRLIEIRARIGLRWCHLVLTQGPDDRGMARTDPARGRRAGSEIARDERQSIAPAFASQRGAMARLLDQRYGEGWIYLTRPSDRRLFDKALRLRLIGEDGALTPAGYRFVQRLSKLEA